MKLILSSVLLLSSVNALPSPSLTEKLVEFFTTYNSTAASAYIASSRGICSYGSAGYAQKVDHLPAFDEGRIHMGSNTKSMASALLGSLLEQGLVRGQTDGWDTPLKYIFPEYATNTPYENITLAAVAGHFSGLDNVPEDFWSYDNPSLSLTEQREAVTKAAFASTPVNTPNTTFLYSNWGYSILGHVMEVSLNQSWEEIFIERFLKPLNMYDAVKAPYPFGPPNEKNSNWGHIPVSASLPHLPCDPSNPPSFLTKEYPTFECDNPPYFGAAGVYSGDILSTANYYGWLIRCVNGENTQTSFPLSQTGCQRLTTPYGTPDPSNPSAQYGYGWGIYKVKFNGEDVKMLNHAGSNTYNYVEVMMFPSLDQIYWAGTNSAADLDKKMINDILAALPTYQSEAC